MKRSLRCLVLVGRGMPAARCCASLRRSRRRSSRARGAGGWATPSLLPGRAYALPPCMLADTSTDGGPEV